MKNLPRWLPLALTLTLPASGASAQSATPANSPPLVQSSQTATSAPPAPAATPAPPGRPTYHVPTYQELLDTALFQSIAAHRTDYVERLLRLGANISAPSSNVYAYTPLHQAVVNGDAPMVDFLLNHGADPNLPDHFGSYPVSSVFESHTSPENWIKILHLLAAHGADLNNPGKNEYPLAVDALLANNLAALNAVLALKPNLEALTPGGQTIAFMAAANGKADFLDAVVVAGANYTPTLGTAAALGDLDTVNQMLADGADPNIRDDRNAVPIIYAAVGGHTNVVEALLNAGADKDAPALITALHRAVARNHLAVADLLIVAGANIDAPDSTYSNPATPIVVAATNGNLSLVKMLDGDGAKLDGALVAAVENNHADIVSYLIDKGADSHDRARNQYIPLMWAAAAGHAGIVDLLLKKFPLAYTQDELNQSLAHAVSGYDTYYYQPQNAFVFNGTGFVPGPPAPDATHDTPEAYRQTVALLANIGARAVVPPKTNQTPLMQAISTGDTQLVSLLLDKAHADPNAVNVSNLTALDYIDGPSSALRANRLPILTLLLDHGGNVTREVPTHYGLSPNPEAFAIHFHQGNVSVLDDVLLAIPSPDNREAVKLLLARGASFRPTGGNQTEDLIRAVAIGDQAKAHQLLAAGADVNQKFRNDWTPLLVACAVGDTDMVKLLLAANASLRDTLAWGYTTASTLAIYSENPDVIRYIFSEIKARQIMQATTMSSLDQMHSPEAAKAYLDQLPSPAGVAKLALQQSVRRSVPPDTFGVILAALPPITPSSDTSSPASATSASAQSAAPASSAAASTTPDPQPAATAQ